MAKSKSYVLVEPGERSLFLFVAVAKEVPGAPRAGAWDVRTNAASSSLFIKDCPATPSGSSNVAAGSCWLSANFDDTCSGVFGAVEPILA